MTPYTQTKRELYESGVAICSQFLVLNKLPLPAFTEGPLPTARKPQGTYGCGHYLPSRHLVWVNAEACARPARGTPRAYSFPGNLTDRTPVGVVAHEIGHAIDYTLLKAHMGLSGMASASVDWVAAVRGPKVSSYEPNFIEAFAESMRVFILNPSLLEWACPKRFQFITMNLGLEATEYLDDPVGQLVEWDADPRIIQAASNRSKKYMRQT